MEENSNWLKSETTGSLTWRLDDLLTELERDNDMSSSEEFSIKEEMIEEVMQELQEEISLSACTEPTTWPASFPLPSSSSSSTSPFADTSERCGASVSDSASTVMAGIEYMGPALKMGSPENGFLGVVEGGRCNDYGVGVAGERMDGCDGGELDDEWLGRLLLWDPPPVDDQS